MTKQEKIKLLSDMRKYLVLALVEGRDSRKGSAYFCNILGKLNFDKKIPILIELGLVEEYLKAKPNARIAPQEAWSTIELASYKDFNKYVKWKLKLVDTCTKLWENGDDN